MASQARACPWGQSPGAGTWGWPQTLSITLRPAPSLVLTTKWACGVMVTPSGRDAAGLGRTARASAAREATGDASPSSPLPSRSSLTPRLMASRSCATTSGRFSNTSTKAACWCVVSGLRTGRFRTAVGRWCALPSSRHGAGARTRTSLSPSSPKAPPCFCKCCCMSIRNVPFAASSPVSSSSSSDAYCRSSAGAMLLRRAVQGGEGEWCATPTSPPRQNRFAGDIQLDGCMQRGHKSRSQRGSNSRPTWGGHSRPSAVFVAGCPAGFSIVRRLT